MTRYQKSRAVPTNAYTSHIFGTLGVEDRGPSVPLDSVKLVQSVKVDQLLALLNRKETKPITGAASTQQLSTIRRETPPPSTGDILRSWVDEWLDSGKTRDGDDPRTRNIERAENAGIAVFDFTKRGRIVLLPDGDSLGLWIMRYKPEPSSTLRPLFSPRPEDYAREHLLFFLLSDLRFRLAKCRKEHCGKYFLLTHTNRLYKRGTLCGTCGRGRSLESARNATATARKTLRGQLWASAAKRFAKRIARNVYWYRDEATKKEIAAYLNATFGNSEGFKAGYRNGISGKWVANVKNWKPIEVAAKKGK